MSQWYVHIEGETLGPVSAESVKNMLAKSRLGFADFVWRPGLTKWVRVYDMDEFAAGLPPYPQSPIPEALGHAPPAKAPAPAPARAKKPAPEEHKPLIRAKAPEPEAPEARGPVPSKQAVHSDMPANVMPLPVNDERRKPDARVSAERRKWPKTRYAVRVPIEGKVESKEYGTFKVSNISEGGLFIRSKDPIAVGTDIKFRLVCEELGKHLDMTGVVIRQGIVVEGHVGFAISFTRLNPAHKRLIDEYVDKVFAAGKVSGE
jgi:hypothetical protein